MTPKFITKVSFNKESVMEIRKHFAHPIVPLLCYVGIIFFLFSAFIFFLLKSYVSAFLFLFYAVLTIILRFFFSYIHALQLSKRLTKLSDKVDLNLFFYDNYFSVVCKDEELLRVYYKYIKKVIKTKNLYTLFTKGSFFFSIPKNSLKNREDFTQFLSKQNNKIRIRNR